MEKKGYIYKITNPNGKIYIGQTTRLKNRMSSYRTCNNISTQQLLYYSIKKYGWDNHTFEVLTEVTIDKTTKKIIKEWTILPKEIGKVLKMCDSSIVKCLKNKKEHHKSFIWQFKK